MLIPIDKAINHCEIPNYEDVHLDDTINLLAFLHETRLEVSSDKKYLRAYFPDASDPKNMRCMDALKSIYELMNLNVPWLPYRFHYNDWCHLLAAKATCDLRQRDESRHVYGWGMDNRFHTARYRLNRTWRGVLSMIHVDDAILRLSKAYGTDVSLYTRVSNAVPTVEVENTPVCPACGRRLRLVWKKYGDAHNLLWACLNINYAAECKDTIKKLWGAGGSPVLISGGSESGTLMMMHDWAHDGHPIPPEFLPNPPSLYTIHAQGSIQQQGTTLYNSAGHAPVSPPLIDLTPIVAPPSFDDVVAKSRQLTRTGFTQEEKDYIIAHYREAGADGFFKKFPYKVTSRHRVQDMAYALEATNRHKGKEHVENMPSLNNKSE